MKTISLEKLRSIIREEASRVNESSEMLMAAEKLRRMREQMQMLADDALELIAQHAPHMESASRSYWYGHIMSALGGGGYKTHATTLKDVIEELEMEGEDFDEDY